MIKIQFTAADIGELHYERFHHPHPMVQRKMEAVWLKSQGLSHKEICRLAKISGNTLRNYLRDFQQGGVNGLKIVLPQGPSRVLQQHQATLEAYFQAHPPATMKEAMQRIEELTGVRRSPNRVRVYLRSIGMQRRKVGSVPAQANPQEQERFKKKSWNGA